MSIRLTTMTTTIGDIVAADFRAAAVFQRFGIDFCCGGRRSFEEACEDAAVDPGEVRGEIDALPAAGREGDVTGWPLDRLIDHILEVHHDYVRAALPTIAKYLTKLNAVHGSRHPELATVASHFARLRTELGQHMMKEEQVLFPYIRELLSTGVADRRNASPFGTIENPIRMIEPDEQTFEIVFSGFFDFCAFDTDVLDRQLLAPDQLFQVVAERRHVLEEILFGFLEGDEHAWLAAAGAVSQKCEAEQGFAASGTPAHQRRPPFGQTTAGYFVESGDAGGDFPDFVRLRFGSSAFSALRGGRHRHVPRLFRCLTKSLPFSGWFAQAQPLGG